MYVTDTDEEAHETMTGARAAEGLLSIFNGASPDMMMTMAQIGAALGGVPKHVKIDPSMAPPMVHGPGAVRQSRDRARARSPSIHDVLGMGRLEVSLGTVNPLPHDAMLSSLKLIGEEVVPVRAQDGVAERHGDRRDRHRQSGAGRRLRRDVRRRRRVRRALPRGRRRAQRCCTCPAPVDR